jgi:heme exporter protein B
VTAFSALLVRELRLALRAGGEVLTLVLFFVMVAAIVPFAVGPDRVLLARLAPGHVWIAAFLSILLGLDRLLRADAEDGSLLLLRLSGLPMPAIVLAKMLAHWLLTGVPVLVASPLLAILLSMDVAGWGWTALALLCGTPGLVAFATFAAAVTVTLRRGGLIGPVLILPFALPVLIFGVGAITGAPGAWPLLLSLNLVAVTFLPFASALALHMGED